RAVPPERRPGVGGVLGCRRTGRAARRDLRARRRHRRDVLPGDQGGRDGRRRAGEHADRARRRPDPAAREVAQARRHVRRVTDRGGSRMTPSDKPLLLMVTTGMRRYREYLMESISSRYRVHLLLGTEPTWEERYITGHTVLHELADTKGADEMCAAAREL